MNKIPSVQALWKIGSCQFSSLVKLHRKLKKDYFFKNGIMFP